MHIEPTTNTLAGIPADRHLVETLYTQGKLTQKARDYALSLIGLPLNWSAWTAAILLMLGITCLLAGVVYFFAYNWELLSNAAIFGLIECAILAALYLVYRFGLQQLVGQLALLSASLFVGVFLAMIGQQYQTGANAYSLFMWWSLLIFAWTIVSCFIVQWVFWLVISNVAASLWWTQSAVQGDEMEWKVMIAIYLGTFNLCFWALREYGLHVKGYTWLQSRWPSLLLVSSMLLGFTFCASLFIIEATFFNVSWYLRYVLIFALLVEIGWFVYYRYINFDITFLTGIVCSVTVVLEVAFICVVINGDSNSEGLFFFIITLFTLVLCTALVKYLRHVAIKGRQGL